MVEIYAQIIRYNFFMSDAAGNMRETPLCAPISVDDTIPPELIDDVTVGSPVAGEDFTISVLIRDNTDTRGLLAVYVNYSVNGMAYQSLQLTHTMGNYWNRTIYILPNATTFIYHIWATDAAGNVIDTYDSEEVPVPVIGQETTLEANAGSDKYTEQGQNITFNGTHSWAKWGVINYSWSFIYDGEEVALYGAVVNFTFDIAGEYLVWLNITDDFVNWDADNLTVTVMDITDPVAVPGANINVDQGSNVIFDASYSYDNVGIINYTWAYGSERYYGVVITLTFYDAGVYIVTLKVIDLAGNFHRANVTVTVEDITGPVADAGKDKDVNMGTKVFFDGSRSIDNIGIVNYTWGFGVIALHGVEANFTFYEPGQYNITLIVMDAAGNTATDYFIVTVGDMEIPVAKPKVGGNPISAGDESNTTVGEQVTFDATDSIDNLGWAALNYTWTIEGMDLYGAKVDYTFEKEGTYTITLKVKDPARNFHHMSFYIKVSPKSDENDPNNRPDNGIDDGENPNTKSGLPTWLISIIIIAIILTIFLITILFILKKPKKFKHEIETTPPENLVSREENFRDEAPDRDDFRFR